MAQVSLLWGTNGTGDGNPYTDTQLFTLFRLLFAHSANLGGVMADTQNELAVSGTSSPVAVATGGAIVYGIPYYNTASENVTIPTPAALTRIDRIVLRADWAAKTVRITRIAGSEGGSAPSMTQSAGATWDIPLATVSITTGGVITVTDAREWLHVVGDGSVTTVKIADDAVTAAKMADYAVDPRAGLSGTNGIVIDPQNGDARGTDAVDLQTSRSNASEVASGGFAVIGGGNGNTAGNVGATVSGGLGNNASAQLSAIGGGQENVSGDDYSIVPGGYGASAQRRGQLAHAAGYFAAAGDAQHSFYVLRRTTTNNTPAELLLDGSTSNQKIYLPTSGCFVFSILVAATRAGGANESAGYKFEGVIDSNGGTVALVGSVAKTVLGEDTSAWDANVTADGANQALIITVTGENSKTIRWVAVVETVEVGG